MNIRDLKYLVAVADLKHFGKASEACFVSQPALSMQIKKLEDTLGVQLFERTNKKVFLTEAGNAITQQARQVLSHIDLMKEMAKAMEDPFSGTFHLGVIPTLAPYLLPHILPHLSELFPKLTLYLVEDTTENLIKKLIKGKLDAALLALPISEPELFVSPLFDEKFYLLVSDKHPLSQQKQVHFSELTQQTLLLLQEGHCLRDQALQVCQHVNIAQTTNFQATSLETLKQMVAFNAGITLVPELSRRQEPGLCYIPFENPAPQRSIALVGRTSCPKKMLLDKMAECIKAITFQGSASELSVDDSKQSMS